MSVRVTPKMLATIASLKKSAPRVRARKRVRIGRNRKLRKPVPRSIALTGKAAENRLSNKMGPPSNEYVRLTYHDQIPLTFSSTGYDYHEYRMNSLFDPDKTLTGHQPRYFDQYAQLYRGYRVHAVKATVIAYTKESSKEAFFVGMMPLAHTSGVPTTYNSICERGVYRSEVVLSNENPVSRRLTMWFKPHLAEGITKREYNVDQEYEAGIGANPAKAPIILLYGRTMDNSTASFGLDVHIDLTFYCKFFDRILPAQS